MRKVVSDLLDCMNRVEDQRSKAQLATIIRREIEHDLVEAGLKFNNLQPTKIEIRLANNGEKLEAIKRYKNRTGCSLMESKNAIEAHMDFRNPSY